MRILPYIKKHAELYCWSTALAALYFMRPDERGLSFCPSTLLGFGKCPGCGIGHAIHDALHLQWEQSVHHHFMGVPAVFIIFYRIKQLLPTLNKQHETQPDQPDTGTRR
jgi:hypothetical protein